MKPVMFFIDLVSNFFVIYTLIAGVIFLLLFWSVFSVYLPASRVPSQGLPLRVMSYNIFYLNTKYSQIADYIQQTQSDVVVLTEVDDPAYRAIGEQLTEYPVREFIKGPHASALAVFSRLPREAITIETTTSVSADEVPITKITVHKNEKNFVVYATHLMPPTWGLFGARNHDLARLQAVSLQETNSHMVIGDLNLTPWSPYFKKFLRITQLRDTRQGNGLGLSWGFGARRAFFFRLPIDHAFVSRDVNVTKRFFGPDLGSDHLPLIVEVD